MNPHADRSELPSLEVRIRRADAERSVRIGYAIGDSLAALGRVLSTLFLYPSSRPKRVRSRVPF